MPNPHRDVPSGGVLLSVRAGFGLRPHPAFFAVMRSNNEGGAEHGEGRQPGEDHPALLRVQAAEL